MTIKGVVALHDESKFVGWQKGPRLSLRLLIPRISLGGNKALSTAIGELSKDPFRYTSVMAAFFPDMIREAIKDSMAEIGMTEQDVRELLRRLESPAGIQ